jgi:hypothetical protein
MNNIGVFRGVLVLFDEKIGWFFYIDGCRVSFKDKQNCSDFISERSNYLKHRNNN